jgi:signal transduction histidine kinase
MEERADQAREGLKTQLDTVKDTAVGTLQTFRQGIDSLKTETSTQLDLLKEKVDVADALTEKVQTVKNQGLARLDQLHGQVQARLEAMG